MAIVENMQRIEMGGKITLPNDVLDALGWDWDDPIQLIPNTEDNTITIVKYKPQDAVVNALTALQQAIYDNDGHFSKNGKSALLQEVWCLARKFGVELDNHPEEEPAQPKTDVLGVYYETGIEEPEILGSGSRWYNVVKTESETRAFELFAQGARNYLHKITVRHNKKTVEWWDGKTWQPLEH